MIRFLPYHEESTPPCFPLSRINSYMISTCMTKRPLPFLTPPVLWGLIALAGMIGLSACRTNKPCQPPVIDEKLYPIPWNAATIQLSQNVSDEAIRNAFVEGGQRANDPLLTVDKITIRRCACDSALINVTLAGNYTIIGSGDPPAAVRSGNNGQSGEVNLPEGSVVAIDYRLDTFDGATAGKDYANPQASKEEQYQRLPNMGGVKKVRIGIFDTGLEEGYLSEIPWQYPALNCPQPGLSGGTVQNGFSFVDEAATPAYRDLNGNQHGSRVAYLLARQFSGSGVIPQIIPFKVLDKNNEGDMFSLLCALETARLNDVQVYNLSLGYYGAVHPLLRTYLGRILANPNHYIVAAAGNRTAADTATNRLLNTMSPPFYPAAFAAEFGPDRLLVATTVQLPALPKVEASLSQNYSYSLVYGVLADQTDRFKLEGQPNPIWGSSFATPILAGRLARLVGQGVINPTLTLRMQMSQGPDRSGVKQVRRNRYLRSNP